ncbi:hypothetical protein EYF80_012816 [Liparis tanakae]|uniref:Secreted protein n=1 Tax=Liparis tanakae TaxID=230148 RepID=A0A4Z2IGA4_9TELE|nr:hypothetical protein EYF80_012816 [Liparis tanakae]
MMMMMMMVMMVMMRCVPIVGATRTEGFTLQIASGAWASGASANLEGGNGLTALLQPALSVTRPAGSADPSSLAKSM